MRWRNWRVAVFVLGLAVLLGGCTAQVSGMQAPVLHDYGPVEWIHLDRRIDQPFVSGPGYSAAVENDPRTTPEVYLERHAALPADAREGDLTRIRVGIRRVEEPDGRWNTGARIEISYSGFPETDIDDISEPILDIAVDDLPRDGDSVVLRDLPLVEPGRVLVLSVIPGDGPHSADIEAAITGGRAPYGGWRARSDGEELHGALVFDTRYERDVDVAGIGRAALRRLEAAGPGFIALYGTLVGGVAAAGVVVLRGPRRDMHDGR